MKPTVILDRISKMSLMALVVLLPLWFLPFTQNVLAFQKQALLVVLVFVGLIALLAKAMSDGKLVMRTGLVYIPVGLVVIGTGLSTVFSLWRYGSFWGWPLDISDSFLTIIAFAFLYVLMVNVIADNKQLFRVLFLFIVSGVIASLFALMQLYGFFVIPFEFAKVTSFNTIGGVNSVAVFASVLLPLALTLAFASKLMLRWLLWVLVVGLLTTVIMINFTAAWIVLIAGLLVLLAFGMWNVKKRAEFGWVSFPMAFIIVAIFFTVFSVSAPGSPAKPVEVSPSQSASIDIAKATLKTSPILGSGPGTFTYDYTQYHSAELNQTIFWGTRFASGGSEFLDWTTTKGLLGSLFLLGLIGVALVLSAKRLITKSEDVFEWMLGLGSFASFVSIVVLMFIYPYNFVLWAAFWILLASLTIFIAKGTKTISLAPSSFASLGASFSFLLILIFGLGLLFLGGQKYVAEIRYLDGVRASQRGDITTATAKILNAASLNSSIDIYWRDLAQLYLSQVNTIAADTTLTPEDRQQRIQIAVANAVTASRQGTQINPANVANWNVQGFVYRNLIGAPGAEGFALESYETAASLEPTSPFSWTELGRARVVQAQTLAQQAGSEDQIGEILTLALVDLNTAIELKNDYAPAHFLVAAVYEQQGNVEEAILKLEETKVVAAPRDVGLAFQLGLIYWRQNEFDKAQAELERAKVLDATHENARYILGLVYDAQGEIDKAVEEFTALAATNPDNTELLQILSNLENGLSALDGLSAEVTPIEETPPEIESDVTPSEEITQ